MTEVTGLTSEGMLSWRSRAAGRRAEAFSGGWRATEERRCLRDRLIE